MTCHHTYGRWVREHLVCAVCGLVIPGEYDSRFVGTFPMEEYNNRDFWGSLNKDFRLTAFTSTAMRQPIVRLDD